VQIAHAPRWHVPGLLLVGDAAHPMSPAFGVGITYAIQDAVATARAVVRAGGPARVDDRTLAGVQRRRSLPARAMQQLQRVAHAAISRPAVLGQLVGAGIRREPLDF
jgi:2-polyprenyl-6-methoxyphenol hydroxylase-like FAD-dependent oxidoreductase